MRTSHPLYPIGLVLLLMMSPLKGWGDLSENAILHAQQGGVYVERNRFEDAIEEYKIAIRLNPTSALAASMYNNLGLCYQQTHQYPLAYASFERAIRLQPGFELYYKNLVVTYVKANAIPAAQFTWLSILRENPKDAEAWYILALIYEQQGLTEEAKESFSSFLELAPNAQLAEAAKLHLK